MNSVLSLGRTVRGDGGSSKEVQRGCKQSTSMEEGHIVGETAKGEMCGKSEWYQVVYMVWEHMQWQRDRTKS